LISKEYPGKSGNWRETPSDCTCMSKVSIRPPSLRAVGGLVLLLVAPGCALYRFDAWVDWRISTGAAVLISLCTFYFHRRDKRRAELGAQRTPESTLHLLELLGGWPGAFLAQRCYRHKTSKLSYQIVFWLIIGLHELIAADYLLGGRITRGLWHGVRAATG
jgi:uncharacterized membrane protein YsdA (DUF1294 family)